MDPKRPSVRSTATRSNFSANERESVAGAEVRFAPELSVGQHRNKKHVTRMELIA